MKEHPELFFLIFVGGWILVSHLVARIGGWTVLSTFYRLSSPFDGERWRFQSGEMRWKVGYNSCLTLGVNASGVYLSVFFLFRLGHPPLFIPWADISVKEKKGLVFTYAEFRFRQAPTIPLRVRERLGRRMVTAAGIPWPEVGQTTVWL